MSGHVCCSVPGLNGLAGWALCVGLGTGEPTVAPLFTAPAALGASPYLGAFHPVRIHA